MRNRKSLKLPNLLRRASAWNVFKSQMREMIIPVFGTQVIYLKGTANQLKTGDALLFVGSRHARFRQ